MEIEGCPEDELPNVTSTVVAANATEGHADLPQPQPHVLIVVCGYSVMFIMAAIANLTVFVSLFRSRHRKSRISLMIRHLAIADLIVTFIMIPIEVCWRLTGRWMAGNVACKIVLFVRAFGPYLSSNVLICVSLDRYFAVLYPLRVNDARRRGKMMLTCAWGASFCYCIPQALVFSVQQHPDYPEYYQCVSFGYFSSEGEKAYNLVCIIELYFIPLAVIIVAYSCILKEIAKNSKSTEGENSRTSNGRLRLRRSDVSNIERARARTLRMTITIVAVYIWCCTPYVVITCWYMLDKNTAKSMPDWLQDAFFMMVVSNSCMNPLVYGSFVLTSKYTDCLRFLRCWKGSDQNLPNGDLATSTGHHGLARRVIKSVLGFKKVNSTKSTGSVLQANAISSAICRTPVNKVASENAKGFFSRDSVDLLIVGAVCKNVTSAVFGDGTENEGKILQQSGLANIYQARPPSPDSPSAGRASFISERAARRPAHRTSFHSEPLPGHAHHPDNTPTTSGSSADLGDHVAVAVGDAQVYYARDVVRTRNV